MPVLSMNVDYLTEFRRLSDLLDKGLSELRSSAHAYANAEAHYRKMKAEAWLNAPRSESRGTWTAAEREAWVNAETADERQARDLADGLRQAALEAVRSRRAQISSLQTLCNLEKEEMAFARTGPELG